MDKERAECLVDHCIKNNINFLLYFKKSDIRIKYMELYYKKLGVDLPHLTVLKILVDNGMLKRISYNVLRNAMLDSFNGTLKIIGESFGIDYLRIEDMRISIYEFQNLMSEMMENASSLELFSILRYKNIKEVLLTKHFKFIDENCIYLNNNKFSNFLKRKENHSKRQKNL